MSWVDVCSVARIRSQLRVATHHPQKSQFWGALSLPSRMAAVTYRSLLKWCRRSGWRTGWVRTPGLAASLWCRRRDNIQCVLGPPSPRSFYCTGTCDEVGLVHNGRLKPDNVSHADVVPRPGFVVESRLQGAGGGWSFCVAVDHDSEKNFVWGTPLSFSLWLLTDCCEHQHRNTKN